MTYLYVILFISFILLNLKISSKISSNNFSEIIMTAFLIYACSLTISGYGLSFINLWYSPFLWGFLPFFGTYLVFILFRNFEFIENRKSTFKLIGRNIQKISEEVKSSSLFQKRFFQLLFSFLFILFGCLIVLFFVSPPNEWDSMTGHLNRVLYFIQNKNLNHFIGTNWNIDTYPKSFPNHQVYPFLMMGKNEIWFKFHNLSSYIISAFAFYGIMKRLGFAFKTRLVIASFYLLIPISIIQSTTTDTDIVLACYLALFVYYLLSYFDKFEKRYILLSALTFSIALAHKITFVFSFIPLLFILGYFIFSKWKEQPFRHWKYILSSYFLTVSFIVAPCGYISNYLHYGHPIGPKEATSHQSIERAKSFENLAKQGTRNYLRYLADLSNPDGLRNIDQIEEINKKWKSSLRKIDKQLSLKLEEEKDFTIIPFSFDRRDLFYNGTPIIGILILLFLCSILYLPFEKNKQQRAILGVFFLAFLVHLAALSYTAAYDPWKGRYMQSSFVFLIPIGGVLIERYISRQKFLTPISSIIFLLLVGTSAICTVLLHKRALLISYYGEKSIFNQNRIERLTVSRPDITRAYSNFEILVPKDATVALATINDDYEYPLWGKHFTRKLIPINPFGKGLQDIPKEANYLFFASSVINPQEGDILLNTKKYNRSEQIIVPGETYYLRKLK